MPDSIEHPAPILLANSYVIAMDNGVSAEGVALFKPDGAVLYEKLPTKNELSYQKEEHHITRLDAAAFRALLKRWNAPSQQTQVVIERPMINPARFKASISAVRCLEAELIILEEFEYPIRFIDSKQWQRVLLPDVVGSAELKKASRELGKTLYPQFKIKKDADPLLIGHYWVNKPALEKPKAKPKKSL